MLGRLLARVKLVNAAQKRKKDLPPYRATYPPLTTLGMGSSGVFRLGQPCFRWDGIALGLG